MLFYERKYWHRSSFLWSQSNTDQSLQRLSLVVRGLLDDDFIRIFKDDDVCEKRRTAITFSFVLFLRQMHPYILFELLFLLLHKRRISICHFSFRCSMLKWIACPYQRSLRSRRSIIFPIILFTITTGLLYAIVEHSTNSASDPQSSTIATKIDEQRKEQSTENCQLTNETIRAIQLAPNDQCKTLLKDISCQINSSSHFFPQSLPRLCPIQSKDLFLFLYHRFWFYRRSFWWCYRLCMLWQFQSSFKLYWELPFSQFMYWLLLETECFFCW